MQYKLNNEQIDEIINLYEVSKNFIKKIEVGLNSTNLVKDADDYFILVCEVCMQYQSNKQILQTTPILFSKTKFMQLSEIIVQQLGCFYNKFQDDSIDNKINYMKILISNKKRHN